MIEIDGSTHSGSGTLLRYSVVLSGLLGEPLHMIRVRARRDKPGLRPQHLTSVLACASLFGGEVEGAAVGSQEIFFYPRSGPKGGDFQWDIGTAGSATMLAYTLLPAALFAGQACRFSITGGLFQDFAPSAFHMQKVLLPTLERMGASVRLEIARPGYVPKGQGRLVLEASPMREALQPIRMKEQGGILGIQGISLASHLEKEEVSRRMADECERLLGKTGYPVQIEIQEDRTAVQKGAALLLWARSDTGCLIGSDQAGKPGRRSEKIAHFVVNSLLEDLATGATADRHLADQLILFAALAGGTTEYSIPVLTDHVESNLWLVEKVLGVKTERKGTHLKIEGIGLQNRKEK